MRRLIPFLIALLVFTGSAGSALAADLGTDTITTAKAEVLDVVHEETKQIPGLTATSTIQTIVVRIIDGPEKGKEMTIDNDYLNLEKGEVFYLNHTVSTFDGRDYYHVSDPYRLDSLVFFIALFVVCVVLFGGIQGTRGLVSLIGSFALIVYLLLPGILAGYSPILLSVGISSLIIVIGSYITHGFNKTTSSAIIGMIITIVLTGALAYAAVHSARLSGFDTEETVYLNLNTQGVIDFPGLLLGGILIGLLGVLYDMAIGQAIAIEELHNAAPHQTKKHIFLRGLRIGREHIGALVNTLAIAYVGASLPLLLLFYSPSADIALIANRELFATEIVRIMISSIGLVLAVPITTAISVAILVQEPSEHHTAQTQS